MNLIAATLILLSAISAPPEIIYSSMIGDNINGLPLGNPQGLAVNPEGSEFLIADAANDRIVVVDTAANFLHSFRLGEGRHNPFGIASDSAGEIIVSPMDKPELWVYDFNGDYLKKIELPETVLPGRIAISPDNNLYVIDRVGRNILELKNSGELVQTIQLESYGINPTGLCFDTRGNLIITSMTGEAVQILDSKGERLRGFGKHGTTPGDFSHPSSSFCDKEGLIWVVDAFRHQLSRFSSDGKYIDSFGYRGIGAGQFFFPVDIKITESGIMGILEKGNGRLQVFRVHYDK